MENKSILAYILLLLPLAVSIYFVINPESLIPPGYDLATDGYLISKTLMIIFTLYLIFKLGFLLFNKKD
ncbi:hypothetical protein AB9M62_25590 [Bacillales bacterium AN1005]